MLHAMKAIKWVITKVNVLSSLPSRDKSFTLKGKAGSAHSSRTPPVKNTPSESIDHDSDEFTDDA